MSAWKGGAAAVLCSLLIACGSGVGPGPAEAGPDDSGQLDAGHDAGGWDAGMADGGADGGSSADAGPDAGAWDAGMADGGVDGGSSADAGTDAGTLAFNPCTWDAGTTPGEAEACATPAPDDLCRTLNPSLASPVVHSYSESYDPDPRKAVYCGLGAYPASGEGMLLHPKQVGDLAQSFALVDRTGADIGLVGGWFSIQTLGFAVIGLPRGFGIFTVILTSSRNFPLYFVNNRGERIATGYGGSGVTALPGGKPGTAFDWEVDEQGCEYRSLVRRYSETGQALSSDWTDLGCFDAVAQMAGNASGCVLATAQSYSDHTHTTHAFWLDEDLRVADQFAPLELATDKGVAFATLLDGSFAIRVGEDWTYRLRPGATTFEPAPCWLRARPGTTFTPIQGGRGYAVIHPSSNGCDRIFEVFTPDGRTCGFTHVDGAAGQCDLALGLDGTISKSAEALDAGAGEPQRCVLKFWPGALGQTGF